MPVPTGVMTTVPAPDEDSAPLMSMSPLPWFPSNETLPDALTVAPD